MSVWLLALPVLVVAAVVVRAVSRRRSRSALRVMMAFDAALVVIALGMFGVVLATGTSTPAVADLPGPAAPAATAAQASTPVLTQESTAAADSSARSSATS